MTFQNTILELLANDKSYGEIAQELGFENTNSLITAINEKRKQDQDFDKEYLLKRTQKHEKYRLKQELEKKQHQNELKLEKEPEQKELLNLLTSDKSYEEIAELLRYRDKFSLFNAINTMRITNKDFEKQYLIIKEQTHEKCRLEKLEKEYLFIKEQRQKELELEREQQQKELEQHQKERELKREQNYEQQKLEKEQRQKELELKKMQRQEQFKLIQQQQELKRKQHQETILQLLKQGKNIKELAEELGYKYTSLLSSAISKMRRKDQDFDKEYSLIIKQNYEQQKLEKEQQQKELELKREQQQKELELKRKPRQEIILSLLKQGKNSKQIAEVLGYAGRQGLNNFIHTSNIEFIKQYELIKKEQFQKKKEQRQKELELEREQQQKETELKIIQRQETILQLLKENKSYTEISEILGFKHTTALSRFIHTSNIEFIKQYELIKKEQFQKKKELEKEQQKKEKELRREESQKQQELEREQRQETILSLLKQGKSTAEIAKVLGFKDTTALKDTTVLRRFIQASNIEFIQQYELIKKEQRQETILQLLKENKSYTEISEILGFKNKKSCYTSINQMKKQDKNFENQYLFIREQQQKEKELKIIQRQETILQLLKHGKSNKQIAEVLGYAGCQGLNNFIQTSNIEFVKQYELIKEEQRRKKKE